MQDNSRKYIKAMLGLFCAMFLILCVYLVYIVGVYGNRWFTSPYNTRVQAQEKQRPGWPHRGPERPAAGLYRRGGPAPLCQRKGPPPGRMPCGWGIAMAKP